MLAQDLFFGQRFTGIAADFAFLNMDITQTRVSFATAPQLKQLLAYDVALC